MNDVLDVLKSEAGADADGGAHEEHWRQDEDIIKEVDLNWFKLVLLYVNAFIVPSSPY